MAQLNNKIISSLANNPVAKRIRSEVDPEPTALALAAAVLVDETGADVGTEVGKALYSATDEAAARTALGATEVGGAVITAASADAGRLALEIVRKDSAAGVDLKTTATAAIYTPPADTEFYLVDALLVYTAVDTVSGGATVKLTNGTGDVTQDLSTGTSPVVNTYQPFARETAGNVKVTAAAPQIGRGAAAVT